VFGGVSGFQLQAHVWRECARQLEALIAESPRLLDQNKEHDDEELGARSSPSPQTEQEDLASAMKDDPPSAPNRRTK
jgi:hypothetical protein